MLSENITLRKMHFLHDALAVLSSASVQKPQFYRGQMHNPILWQNTTVLVVKVCGGSSWLLQLSHLPASFNFTFLECFKHIVGDSWNIQVYIVPCNLMLVHKQVSEKWTELIEAISYFARVIMVMNVFIGLAFVIAILMKTCSRLLWHMHWMQYWLSKMYITRNH